MSANNHHWEPIDAKSVILSVVAAETVIRDAVAFVSAALLPVAMFRLPAMSAIALPSDLLHACLFRAPMLGRPLVLLLMLGTLLILLPSGLPLLLFCSVVLQLALLPLLILLPLGLLLLLFRRVVLLLPLFLPLLILLPLGLLLLLFCSIVLVLPLLLPLLILLPFGLLLLLLSFRLSLLLLLRGLRLFFLFVLPCVSRPADSEQQEECGRTNDSSSFHGVTSIASTHAPLKHHLGPVDCLTGAHFDLSPTESVPSACHPIRIRESE